MPQSQLPEIIPCPAVNPGTPGKTTEWRNFLRSPGWKSTYSYFSAKRSLSAAQEQFPNLSLWNDKGDAFRHFRWSFSMARAIGPESAAAFANAHEVSNPNAASETAMDLHNNAVGRAMGADPLFADISPTDAGMLALRSGCLQTGLN